MYDRFGIMMMMMIMKNPCEMTLSALEMGVLEMGVLLKSGCDRGVQLQKVVVFVVAGKLVAR